MSANRSGDPRKRAAAERKAHLAQLTRTDPATVRRTSGPGDAFDLWVADLPDGRRIAAVMPKLLPGAPASVRRRVRDRATANLTGRCPRCDAPAGVPDAQAGFQHETGCPLVGDAGMSRWIDPKSQAALIAIAQGGNR
jgi:hypothetical protein